MTSTNNTPNQQEVEETTASTNNNRFKQAQNKFRRNPVKPDRLDDLEELIDFGRPSPLLQRLDLDFLVDSNEFGCYYRGPVFTLTEFPGFLYAPKALSLHAQHELAYAAVTQYCERPHTTNIHLVPPSDTLEICNDTERMWDVWKQEHGFAYHLESVDLEVDTSMKSNNTGGDKTNKRRRYRFFQKLSWATMGYRYDWTNRSYSDAPISPIPEDLHRVAKFFASRSLIHLSRNNENQLSSPSNSSFVGSACIINFYNSKSLMGGHADDAELALDKPIVSFSVGRPAVFLLGGPSRAEEPIAILVRSGDVMMMGGASRRNFHAMARLLPADESLLPPVHPDHAPNPDDQVNNITSEPPPLETMDNQAALDSFLAQHRINVNLRQVYPSDTL